MKNRPHVLPVLIVVVSAAAHLACATPQPANTNQPAVNANTASSNSSPAKPAQPAASNSTTGTIEVTSVPPGAGIVLIATDDDTASEPQRKGATPATISGVKPGKYTVNLEKQGYRFYQKEVTVKVGKSVKIAASLKKS